MAKLALHPISALAGSLLLALASVACQNGAESGNGLGGTVYYLLPPFAGIVNDSAIDVVVARGEEHHAMVTCDQDLLDHIALGVRDGTLHIAHGRTWTGDVLSIRPQGLCQVRVAMPGPLVGARCTGSGRLTITDPLRPALSMAQSCRQEMT